MHSTQYLLREALSLSSCHVHTRMCERTGRSSHVTCCSFAAWGPTAQGRIRRVVHWKLRSHCRARRDDRTIDPVPASAAAPLPAAIGAGCRVFALATPRPRAPLWKRLPHDSVWCRSEGGHTRHSQTPVLAGSDLSSRTGSGSGPWREPSVPGRVPGRVCEAGISSARRAAPRGWP